MYQRHLTRCVLRFYLASRHCSCRIYPTTNRTHLPPMAASTDDEAMLRAATGKATATRSEFPHAPRKVDDELYLKNVEDFASAAKEAGLTVVETSPEDMRTIEKLLGLEANSFAVSQIVATKSPVCKCCGRHVSFLDVVHTGTKLHGAEFLRSVFLGDYGKVLNSADHQRVCCYKCNAELPAGAPIYSAPQMPNATQLPGGQYLFPVYTYRF
jgi:hypothetical protein